MPDMEDGDDREKNPIIRYKSEDKEIEFFGFSSVLSNFVNWFKSIGDLFESQVYYLAFVLVALAFLVVVMTIVRNLAIVNIIAPAFIIGCFAVVGLLLVIEGES